MQSKVVVAGRRQATERASGSKCHVVYDRDPPGDRDLDCDAIAGPELAAGGLLGAEEKRTTNTRGQLAGCPGGKQRAKALGSKREQIITMRVGEAQRPSSAAGESNKRAVSSGPCNTSGDSAFFESSYAGARMGELRGRWHHLTGADQLEVLERLRAGASLDAVAQAVGCSRCTVQRLVSRTGGVKPRVVPRSALRLSLAEREEISRGVVAGESCRSIARRLARAPSTISRELIAGSTSQSYRAWRADMTAHERARRPKPAKLLTCLRLRAEVERGLRRRWSPEQIATRLIRDFPADSEMRVSHETIYQSLFVQSRGVFRTELTRWLRTGRPQRRPVGRASHAGHLKDMVLISARPAEVEDRAVPGHWEGDLLLGRRGQSAIATLVERQTRFVLLVRLPHGRTADAVQRRPRDRSALTPGGAMAIPDVGSWQRNGGARAVHDCQRRAGVFLRSA